MPSHLKELVHARMAKTGERYEQALRHVRAQESRPTTPAANHTPWYASRERASHVADTAFSIAAVRAEEATLPVSERLFEDRYASLFAAEGAHVAESTQRYLALPFFRDGIRLRTRFIDDVVEARVRAGADRQPPCSSGRESSATSTRPPSKRACGSWPAAVERPARSSSRTGTKPSSQRPSRRSPFVRAWLACKRSRATSYGAATSPVSLTPQRS